MKKVIINASMANALDKIATRSKMNDWFIIHTDEEHNLYVDVDDVITLFEGATEFDLSALKSIDVYNIIELFLRIHKN